MFVGNVHHVEKQMFGTNVEKKVPITTSEDHAQPTDKETARYNSPPKTNFIMQQAKHMENIDSKDKVWISKMLEVTQNLSMKYAIPSHLRDVVEAKKKNKRPLVVPKVFASIWRNPDLLKSAPFIQAKDPTPVIDWIQVKFKPVLPKPELFPVDISRSINVQEREDSTFCCYCSLTQVC